MPITLTGQTVERDGTAIGTFNAADGIVTLSVEQPPPIKAQIKAAMFTATRAEVKGFALMEAVDAGPPPPSVSTGTAQAAPAATQQAAKAPEPAKALEVAKTLDATQVPETAKVGATPAASSAIPPCPKGSIAQGDKSPDVIAWYKQYQPEEYKRRYQGRLKEVV